MKLRAFEAASRASKAVLPGLALARSLRPSQGKPSGKKVSLRVMLRGRSCGTFVDGSILAFDTNMDCVGSRGRVRRCLRSGVVRRYCEGQTQVEEGDERREHCESNTVESLKTNDLRYSTAVFSLEKLGVTRRRNVSLYSIEHCARGDCQAILRLVFSLIG